MQRSAMGQSIERGETSKTSISLAAWEYKKAGDLSLGLKLTEVD
jgi:hypothetical protein